MLHPIREIMETDAYTCHRSQSVGDVIKILVEKEIGGLPVVDDDLRVVGFISDGDIMKAIARQNPQSMGALIVLYDDTTLEDKVLDVIERNVMELANRRLISVHGDQSIEEVAKILGQRKIKKVPVLEDGKLIGLVQRSTIIRYIFRNIIRESSIL